MKPFSHLDQVAFSDLSTQVFDADFSESFQGNGSFVKQKRGNAEYYYFKSYQTAVGDRLGKHRLSYVGRVDDEAVRRRVENFGRLKSLYRTRLQLASTLRGHGCPAPSALEGEVLAVLAGAGFFRGNAVLVGTIAFQCFAGMLSVHLPETTYRTADIDLAQPSSAIAVTDHALPDPETLLREVDPSFAAIFHPGNASLPVGFQNRTGFRVEFLAPIRRADESVRTVAGLPAVGAQALKYLDYLLEDPRDGLILHKAGLGVRVPAPARYAVHKLLISDIRRAQGPAKAEKDLVQVGTLVEAMAFRRCLDDLGFAWIDAARRGPKWLRNLKSGWSRLPEAHRERISAGIRQAIELDGADADLSRLDPAAGVPPSPGRSRRTP